jgi:hypothetical protein
MSGWVTQADIDGVRDLGVRVSVQSGFFNKSDMMLNIRGFMLHHDAMALGVVNDNPNDDYNVPNYMGTPGVLGSQIWASTRGDVVFMAAGGKGHAGRGQWRAIPTDAGNNYCAALETDHTPGTGWSNPLRRAIDVVSFVIVRNHNIDVDNWMCGHKEYAPTRKQDPDDFDLNGWRNRIKSGALFGGGTETRKCFGWW